MIRYLMAGVALALSAVASGQPAMVIGAGQDNVLRVGTPIMLKTVRELTTKGKHLTVGERFPLEVAEPVLLNGQIVVPVGSPAVGEITSVRNKGMWGKSGNIESRLLYVTANGRQIRLEGDAGADKGKKAGAGAIAVSAIVFLPTGFFWTGTSAVIPPGTRISGLIGEDVPIIFAGASAPLPMTIGGQASSAPAVAATVTPVSTPAVVAPVTIARSVAPTTVPNMPDMPQWRQASYSPGLSVAFVDAASIWQRGQTVRFWTMLYYRPDQGSDNYAALREADCDNRSFRDVSLTYRLGNTVLRTEAGSGAFSRAAPGSVNEEIVLKACNARNLGKLFEDPGRAASLFFGAV